MTNQKSNPTAFWFSKGLFSQKPSALVSLVLSIIITIVVLPNVAFAQDEKTLKVFAKASLRNYWSSEFDGRAKLMVINDSPDSQTLQKLKSELNVKEIDWRKQMVIIYGEGTTEGTTTNPARRAISNIEFSKFKILAGSIFIEFSQQGAYHAPSTPIGIALVERFDGTIRCKHIVHPSARMPTATIPLMDPILPKSLKVIRSPEELASLSLFNEFPMNLKLPLTTDEKNNYRMNIEMAFGIKTIDWKKQMVIAAYPEGGCRSRYNVATIEDFKINKNNMTIYTSFNLESTGRQLVTLALVPRFDGMVLESSKK